MNYANVVTIKEPMKAPMSKYQIQFEAGWMTAKVDTLYLSPAEQATVPADNDQPGFRDGYIAFLNYRAKRAQGQ